jgi:hypothetical protein
MHGWSTLIVYYRYYINTVARTVSKHTTTDKDSYFSYHTYVLFYLLPTTRNLDNPESQKYEEADCSSVFITSIPYYM